MDKLIDSVLALREDVSKRMDALLTKVSDEKRSALTEEETSQFDAMKTERDALDARIVELRKEHEAREAVKALRSSLGETGVATVKDPETYRKGGSHSYFRDLVFAQTRNDRSAIDRLVRNDREMSDSSEFRALSTTDGAGSAGAGEFVPPLWAINDFIAYTRPGRVVANQLRQMPLPAGTDTIILPKITGGTAVAEQTSQNSSLQNTDATTNSVSASVASLGGVQVVSVQILEQSPVSSGFDQVILQDLAADYAQKLDTFAISNNASGKYGLLNVSGINTSTYTSGSPTAAGLASKVLDGIQKIHTNRYMPAQKIFMTPARWAWIQAAGTLVVPVGGGNMGYNAAGVSTEQVAEGLAGTLYSLPVYLDANIPSNLGTGTNEDRIIIARTDDVILYEGSPRAEVFRETKADQNSVLLRMYNYVALHSARLPKAISVVSGTGLVTPSF